MVATRANAGLECQWRCTGSSRDCVTSFLQRYLQVHSWPITNIKDTPQHFDLSGHGAPSMGIFPNKRLFWFIQVGGTCCTIRRDWRYLLVLPCPKHFLAIACVVFCMSKFIFCGNVELNSGQNTEPMLQQLLQRQNKLSADVTALRNELNG